MKAGAPKRSTKPKKRRSNLAKADTALGGPQEKRGLKPQAKAKGDKSLGGEASSGHRGKRTNVKTARYRKHSSTLWLDRQLNDPYVARAKTEGFRSRAAFKLIELDEKYALLKSGARIVDLGCAPGGWCQVAARAGASKLVGIDYLAMPAVEGADILELDFLDPDAPDRLRAALGGEADLVLSDMAAPTTGHRATDHLRVVALAEAALDFAEDVLAPGGGFVCKVFQGGAEGDLLARLRGRFTSVKHAKPKASRPESPEKYVVATGFKRDAETPSSADGDDPTVSN
ncbi:MAG: RlmE family RNA methyltransferase [Pseudomonadota bacterium]